MSYMKINFFKPFLIIFVLLLFFQPSCRAATEKHVLILNSYHRGYSWSDYITESAINFLQEQFESIEIYVEYMDTKRLYSDQALDLFKQTLILKYKNIKLDAVISSDDNSLSFLIENKKDVFGDVPVVFCGINNHVKAFKLQDNPEYTGVIEVPEIKSTIDIALKLCPDTKKVMFISDSTPTSKGSRLKFLSIKESYKDLEFIYLNGEDLTTAELISILKNAQPDTIAVVFAWFRDKNGGYCSLEQVGLRITQNSAVPVFALNDFWMEYGAVGGKLNSGRAHGIEAAFIASKIIDGTRRPKDFSIQKCQLNTYVFDWNQLRKWNFDLSLLPEGSAIINRKISFFQRHKKFVISVLAFIVFQTLVIVGFISNMVLRKRAERDNRYTAKRFQNLVESINDWVWEVDGDLKYTFASSTVEKILGYKPEEIMGKTPFDFMVPEEKQQIADHVEEKIKEKKSITMLENTIFHKKGHRVILETSGTPVFDDNDNFLGFRGVDRDISYRKKIEKEREQLLKDLSIKNEELESIVYIASHDLRSPLVNIQGFSNEVSEVIDSVFDKIENMDIPVSEKQEIKKVSAEFVDTSFGFIQKNIVKMDQLLSSLLRLARLGSSAIEIKNIDMDKLIESIFLSMHYQIKNIGIETEIASLPACAGDYTQINQVFSNIIDNAVKYIAPDRPAKIKVSAKLNDSHVTYCVEDNGIGIDPLYHKKVFDIFQRLNPNDNLEGIGIGLTIVKRIVGRNSGNIWISSKLNEGCKVFIELPLSNN